MDFPAGVTHDAAVLFLSTKMDADLIHMFQESGVPVPVQYRLGQAFNEVRKFASLADTRGELREALKADVGLEATGLVSRAAVAGVVSAWEGARKYCEKADELKAEARVLGVSRPVTQTDRAAMKASFEAVHGKLEEAYEPSEDYLAQKIEEMETSEIIASPLSDVTSRKTVKVMGLQTSVDGGGSHPGHQAEEERGAALGNGGTPHSLEG